MSVKDRNGIEVDDVVLHLRRLGIEKVLTKVKRAFPGFDFIIKPTPEARRHGLRDDGSPPDHVA